MLKFLDHLEEWLIAFLMGAATLLIFVAVVHRYVAGIAIPGVQDALLAIDLSWAQELCIYMFVWMAKFGAVMSTCNEASVETSLCGLCGANSMRYASAMVAIFFISRMPPQWTTSG